MAKFGQRIVRGVAYGFPLGFILGMIAYLIATAVNTMNGSQVLNATAFLLFGFSVGAGSSIAIEISKDMEEEGKAS